MGDRRVLWRVLAADGRDEIPNVEGAPSKVRPYCGAEKGYGAKEFAIQSRSEGEDGDAGRQCHVQTAELPQVLQVLIFDLRRARDACVTDLKGERSEVVGAGEDHQKG